MDIIICDDDINLCNNIKLFIDKNYSHNVQCCYDGESAISYFQKNSYDLLIIDIDLGSYNGIELANIIYRDNPLLKVIFITAYGNHFYNDIYGDLKPHGYIDKPITYNILKFFIKQLEEEINNNNLSFSFSYDKKTYNIPLHSIIYFRSDKRICEIVTQTQTYRYYDKLSEVEKKVTSDFLRCHHSFLVNKKNIYSTHKKEMILTNNEIIPISNARINEVRRWHSEL